jgi:retron-type reverse transcriptase
VCKWVIKGNISRFFETVSHSKLIFLLQKKIKDKRFISLISKGLKAKALFLQYEIINLDNVTSQTKIISPLLSNIYLHELDKYLTAYIKELNGVIKYPYSFNYIRFAKKLKNRKADKTLSLTNKNTLSNAFIRMKYVRYADNFIVGVTCSKVKALEIKNHIEMFLKKYLYLKFSNKTLLTNFLSKKTFNYNSYVSFLNFFIFMHQGVPIKTANNNRRFNGKSHVILKVNQKEVICRLAEKKFCTKNGSPKPKFIYMYNTKQ